MLNYEELIERSNKLLNDIRDVEIDNASAIKSRNMLMEQLVELRKKVDDDRRALDISTHAIEILRGVSDEAVTNAYKFLQESLNATLAEMFKDTTRRIKINEYTRQNQYPQLELILDVGNGITRSIKSDSGHGIAQIISFLSVVCLIVITGSRRLVIIDEVLSGLSIRNRKVICEVMWSFTEIGFQFIVNEHGLVVKGAQVYHFEMKNDEAGIKDSYIADTGAYLMATDSDNMSNVYNINEEEDDEEDEVDNIMSLTGEPLMHRISRAAESAVTEGEVLGV